MADDFLQLSDTGRLNTIYQPIIVSSLNDRSVLRSAIPRVPQKGGDKCRWVLKTARSTKYGSTTETAEIEVGHTTRNTAYSDWAILYAGIGISDIEIAAMASAPYSVTGMDPVREAIQDATRDFMYAENNQMCKGPDLTGVATDMNGLDNWINDSNCPSKVTSPAGIAYAGNSYVAATVDSNSGTQRDITLSLIDDAIDNIEIAGGVANLAITKQKQRSAIAAQLTAMQRFSTTEIAGGFTALSYRDIPIIADAYIAATNNTGVDKTAVAGWNGNVYVVDTNYCMVKVLQDAMIVDLTKKGFQTRKAIGAFEQFVFTSPNKSAKIVDLT